MFQKQPKKFTKKTTTVFLNCIFEARLPYQCLTDILFSSSLYILKIRNLPNLIFQSRFSQKYHFSNNRIKSSKIREFYLTLADPENLTTVRFGETFLEKKNRKVTFLEQRKKKFLTEKCRQQKIELIFPVILPDFSFFLQFSRKKNRKFPKNVEIVEPELVAFPKIWSFLKSTEIFKVTKFMKF